MGKHFKVSEVARQLNVHDQTIRRAIASGRLKAFKTTPKGAWLIAEGELNKYLKGE